MSDQTQARARAAAVYPARLDRTLKELQDRVREQEAALRELQEENAIQSLEPSQPSQDPDARLHQLRIFNATFQSLAPQKPYLPPPDSPIPALLAHRRIEQNISDSKAGIVHAESSVKDAQSRLEKERADLSDAKLINKALEDRIRSLKTDLQTRTQKSSSQIAADMIEGLKKKKIRYDDEFLLLVTAFNEFIEDTLAPMLAAEELGGPVVGEMPDVDDDDLGQGFSSQGKVKKSKAIVNDDKRQRTLDQIWGPAPQGETDDWTEQKAAGAEFRSLTQQLLNNLVEADGVRDDFVQLPRESAAARFLVRSKVAYFDYRDATKLRSYDFGKELLQ